MKRFTWFVLSSALLLAAPRLAVASAETLLSAATAAGHPVFLVVTQTDAAGVDVARAVVADAQKLSPSTSIVELDRLDAANVAVVRRYRLESVPVPLILVIAANGVAAGGARPNAVTAQRLVDMIPSAAKASMLKSIDEKKATVLVFWRASMAERAAALQAANDAATALKGAATVVSIDVDAAAEARFIAEMRVDPKSAVPIVGVYNAKGQPTETLLGVAKAEVLVAAATKEIHECCPGGRCK